MRTGWRCALLALAASAPLQAQQAPASAVASFDSAWAAIARTFWDTTLVNGRWRTVKDSLRAGLEDAGDDRVRAAIRALIAVPEQSHFVLIPERISPLDPAAATPSGTRARPGTTGIEARLLGDTVVVWRVQAGSPAALAGIRPGASITHFDTLALDGVLGALHRAMPADSARALKLLNAVAIARLAGSTGDTVRVTVRDASGDVRTHALERAPLAGQLTRFGNLPPMVVRSSGDSVALGDGRQATVITFSGWFPVIATELDDRLFAARGAPGLILDLRGNPGGVVGMLAGISGHLLDSSVAIGTMRGRGATIHFVANPRRVDRSGARVVPYGGPVAILIDGFTGSTSEFFTSGMQALGRARVFGVPSAGEALPSAMARLPNGDVMMHAIADHEDAGGRRVEGVGIMPDVVTPLTRGDLKAGRDAALEAARDWLARSTRN